MSFITKKPIICFKVVESYPTYGRNFCRNGSVDGPIFNYISGMNEILYTKMNYSTDKKGNKLFDPERSIALHGYLDYNDAEHDRGCFISNRRKVIRMIIPPGTHVYIKKDSYYKVDIILAEKAIYRRIKFFKKQRIWKMILKNGERKYIFIDDFEEKNKETKRYFIKDTYGLNFRTIRDIFIYFRKMKNKVISFKKIEHIVVHYDK